ncbi:CubicO group peptidase, beta-lactamase class C family [Dyella jiangningensis]|uniref:serine hydrolase domain-containing protein n=1 Tax=Dyella sp. AtDHG13 TaxID=1938897 RepID=UPI000883B325|nr:serine hydrolase domain-containing protein [Dyella sp. AtDHG13]PXV59180.1 CubicO group peptidase (beta-lactamase class C family) [Dyella sp. AtDHG13]SDK25043.1 CubicO group peptidase, beta-lactamase class C family [Dyella jiangningensis]
MFANASALMRRLSWTRRATALAALLMPMALWAQAQIQITPLPETRHAAVTQLGAAELSARDVQPWLDGEMSSVMQKAAVTGAVVVVVKDGEVLVSKGYGYADPDEKKAVDPASTMFRVGAMSGVVTSTAVMQLVEQHKLELDADVNRYLDFTIPPRDGKPVTLRDLLTYTPGFEDVTKRVYLTDPKQLEQNEDWLRHGVRVPARIYPAGDVPAYSTYGMALAGHIVQRASGQRFDEYIERHVFEPLGMQHATFRQSTPLWENLASNAGPAGAPTRKLVLPTPALGLAISGGDMAQLMIAQLQYGRAGNAQLLEQATVKQMQDEQRAAIPGLPGMALGFAHMDRDGQAVLGHEGDFNGYHSLLALLPEHHAGIFIATAGGDAQPLLRPLVERFSDRYFPPLPQLKPPTLGTDKTHAAQLTGRYTSSITSQGNMLALRDLFRQQAISVAADGSLIAPMFGAAHWREVKPYLWIDDATGRRLGAVVHDGQVRMVSTDALSPMEVYLPATGASPASVARIAALLATVFALIVLSWPLVGWLGRRHASLALPEQDVRGYRLSRLTALLYLLFAGGWYLILPRLGMPHLETRLSLLFLLGCLAVLGTVPAAWETWRAWRSGAWWRRISSTILLLACLGAIAFIACWHLLSYDPSY